MSNPPDIQSIVGRFVDAFNENDPDLAPLTSDVVYRGPMIPEPLRGEAAVRRHIDQVAPFVASLKIRRLVAEGDSAAAILEFTGVNGVVIEGADFFRFRDGLICEDLIFFDTRPLIRGSS